MQRRVRSPAVAALIVGGGEVSVEKREEDMGEMEEGEVNGMGRPWHFIYVKRRRLH